MSDEENPNLGVALSTVEAVEASRDTRSEADSAVVAPTTTTNEDQIEARRRLFMEYLESAFPIEDIDLDLDDDDDEEDDDRDDPSPGGCARCCTCFREKMFRILNIVAYPFVVLFTIISLFMIVTFCIIPTIFCMTLGICAYYCFMDDPIPLHLLLRYMFGPDSDAENAFGNGNDSSYPLAHNRTLIQSKLIIRRLLRVISSRESGSDDEEDSTKKYPRTHPSSIWIWTESKCLQFSEPLVFKGEDEDEDDKDEKKRKPRYRRRQTGDAPAADSHSGIDEQDISASGIVSDIPRYHGSVVREISNRNLREALAPEVVPMERNQGEELVIVEIPSGDGTISSIHENDDVVVESSSDEEMGEVPISVGRGGDEDQEERNGDQEWDSECDAEPVNQSDTAQTESEEPSNDSSILVCQECNDSECVSQDASGDKASPNTAESDPTVSAGADYFGIESDSRDRHTACDICLLEYEIGDEVAWSPNMACSHTYHKDCVLDW